MDLESRKMNIWRGTIAGLFAAIAVAIVLASCAPAGSSSTKPPTAIPGCPTATVPSATSPAAAISHSQQTLAIGRGAPDCAATATAGAQSLINVNNAKTVAAITAWETDPQKMLASQDATTSQFTNDLPESPNGRTEAPIGVALVGNLDGNAYEAYIDGNGVVRTNYLKPAGQVSRATLAQLIRDGDKRANNISLYGIDLGSLTFPDGGTLLAEGFLVTGKPIAVLWGYGSTAQLTVTGSFSQPRTDSNSEVQAAVYVPLGIGHHVGASYVNDLIGARKQLSQLDPNSPFLGVKRSIAFLKRHIQFLELTANVLSYLLTGDESLLGVTAPYVIRSADGVIIPTKVDDAAAPGDSAAVGGFTLLFYGLLVTASNG
jgi:hypothetical protein